MARYTPLKSKEAIVGKRVRLMRLPEHCKTSYYLVGMVGTIDEIDTEDDECPVSVKLDNYFVSISCAAKDLAIAEDDAIDWPYHD